MNIIFGLTVSFIFLIVILIIIFHFPSLNKIHYKMEAAKLDEKLPLKYAEIVKIYQDTVNPYSGRSIFVGCGKYIIPITLIIQILSFMYIDIFLSLLFIIFSSFLIAKICRVIDIIFIKKEAKDWTNKHPSVVLPKLE